MTKIKQGATVRVLISDMSPEEWALFDTADEIKSESRLSTRDGSLDILMNVSLDRVNKTVEVYRVVDDAMPVGTYLLDIAITKNGETLFVPVDEYITFNVIPGITGVYI